MKVKGVAAMTSIPMYLNTNAPHLKSLKDLTPNDKIAVTAVKVSIPAIIMQMAAIKEYGKADFAHYDPYTVSLTHPDRALWPGISKRDLVRYWEQVADHALPGLARRPLAIVRTTDVRVGPLSSVDDRFAWDEGEGDRTRAWWLDAHTRFFSRQCTAMGLTFSDDIGVVFERFELVWPTIRT